MNELELTQMIVGLWDETVGQSETPVPLAETINTMTPRVAAYLESNDRDFEAEAKRAIRSVLRNERQNRTNQLHREVDWLVDYMENPEAAGFGVEALLDRAYSLGTVKGEDKALRRWTLQDLQNKIVGLYRVAADATESARKNDTALTRLMLLVQAQGVSTVGEAVDGTKQVAA